MGRKRQIASRPAQARPIQERLPEFGEAPLAGYDSPASLDSYPWWPQVEGFDYESAVALAQRACRDYAVIGPWVSLFEIYCQLRGLEADGSPARPPVCRGLATYPLESREGKLRLNVSPPSGARAKPQST